MIAELKINIFTESARFINNIFSSLAALMMFLALSYITSNLFATLNFFFSAFSRSDFCFNVGKILFPN